MAGHLRRQVLFFAPLPLPVAAVVALLVGGQLSASGWTVLLALSVAVASMLMACIVQPTPLPENLSPEASVRRSLHRFRQITALRIGLSAVPVLVGAAASLVGGGMLPLAAAVTLYWPQLLLALPGYFTVSRARHSMEAWGTKAYLWAGLALPTSVRWPLITWLRPRLQAWLLRARALLARLRAAATASTPPTSENTADSGATDAPPAETAEDSPRESEPSPPTPPASSSSLIPGLPILPTGSAEVSSRPVARRRQEATRPTPRSRRSGRPKAKN
ncbi:hypothetical protein [Salinactinospora qingdaonensis]|uniref:Uncharacterized protein n=1 Tax=Salinactinospora qingdaonensis TaxID=702744 RepID=A0ABP7EZV5_9ACTN